jgi:hypothetical protein
MRAAQLCLAICSSLMVCACKNKARSGSSVYLHAGVDKNNVHQPDTQFVPGAARITCDRAFSNPNPAAPPVGCQVTGPDGETLKMTPGPAELGTKRAGNVTLECYGGTIPTQCDATATW